MSTFYEFFAGGGMARAGLGQEWTCLFSNDFDPKKVAAYASNWGSREVHFGDVNGVHPGILPDYADLVWASFPCQDLSLAGGGAGLQGNRSGTFWPFWNCVKALIAEDRKPRFVALENVTGMLTSHGGRDIRAICEALASADYRYGAVVVDALHFVPQSRKRVFIVAVDASEEIPEDLVSQRPVQPWHPASLVKAVNRLPVDLARSWLWWNLPTPPAPEISLSSVIEESPASVAWHTAAETQKLLGMMSDFTRRKLERAMANGARVVATAYRRTRPSPAGGVQRLEIRLDGVAGCLRTPAGGSSRQILILADRNKVRSRLISSREAARLMGLDDTFRLPQNYNDAYHLVGDGLAVPAVSFVARNLLDPLAAPVEKALAA